jgi:hypothetical protein
VAAFKDPVFGCTYGPSKYGKTTDLLYSFPNAYYLAAPGALKPSEGVVGFTVPPENIFDAKGLPEAGRKIEEVAKLKCLKCAGAGKILNGAGVQTCLVCQGTGKRYGEVGVDDFSLLAERSASELEGRNLTGYKFWGALRDEVLDFRDIARRAGMHVILNCHEAPPRIAQGTALRGGPKLPGRLPEDLPAACDIVVRATLANDLGGGGKLGWPGVYRCSPQDTGFISGDRHGVTPDFSPMNLGELMRAAGFTVHRAPGLEWMEGVVAKIASTLVTSGVADVEVLRQAAPWLAKNMADKPRYLTPEARQVNLLGLHVRWIIRDAYDRALIWRSRQNPLSLYKL